MCTYVSAYMAACARISEVKDFAVPQSCRAFPDHRAGAPPSCNYGDIGCYTSANHSRAEGVKKVDRVKTQCIRNSIYFICLSLLFSMWLEKIISSFLSAHPILRATSCCVHCLH